MRRRLAGGMKRCPIVVASEGWRVGEMDLMCSELSEKRMLEEGGGKDPAAQGLHELNGEVGCDRESAADQPATGQMMHVSRHALCVRGVPRAGRVLHHVPCASCAARVRDAARIRACELCDTRRARAVRCAVREPRQASCAGRLRGGKAK